MLRANKSKLSEYFFAIYNKNLLKRKFQSFNISGLEKLNLPKNPIPFLIYANHSSWWDGLIAFYISSLMKMDSFIMMEEKQLKNLQFFRKLGAFSVVRENSREALKSLKYASDILIEDPRRTLWIFPQGEILPNDIRPLKLYSGLAHIVRNVKNCLVIPTAIRLEFLQNFKPDIFVKIGNPIVFDTNEIFDKKKLINLFTENLLITIDELKLDILNQSTSNYCDILQI